MWYILKIMIIYPSNGCIARGINDALSSSRGPVTLQIPAGQYQALESIELRDDVLLVFDPCDIFLSQPQYQSWCSLGKTRGVTIRGAGYGTRFHERPFAYDQGYEVFEYPNDSKPGIYGDLILQDFVIVGSNYNEPTGNPQTISLANAKNVRIINVHLRGTHAIGFQAGGTAGQELDCADNIILENCSTDDVATQHVAPVNVARFRMVNCDLRAGPNTGGGTVLLDLEKNAHGDAIELIQISNCTFDVGKGLSQYPRAIAIQGQEIGIADPRTGPILIEGNTIIGNRGDVGSMPEWLQIRRVHNVAIRGNVVKHAGGVSIDSSRAIELNNNRVEGGVGGPFVTLAASDHCRLFGNTLYVDQKSEPDWDHTAQPLLRETLGSDWNTFEYNRLSWHKGWEALDYIRFPLVELCGRNSREVGTIVENPNELQLRTDGLLHDERDAVNGSNMACNGERWLPINSKGHKSTIWKGQPDIGEGFFTKTSETLQTYGTRFTVKANGAIVGFRRWAGSGIVSLWSKYNELPQLAEAFVGTVENNNPDWNISYLEKPVPVRAGEEFTVAATYQAGDLISWRDVSLPDDVFLFFLHQSVFLAGQGRPQVDAGNLLFCIDVIFDWL